MRPPVGAWVIADHNEVLFTLDLYKDASNYISRVIPSMLSPELSHIGLSPWLEIWIKPMLRTTKRSS